MLVAVYAVAQLVGGALRVYGYAVPAFAAAALAFLNMLSLFFFLPKSLTEERQAALARQSKPPFTLGALIAPTIGGFLLGSLGTWAPGIFSALIMLWVVSSVWRRLVVHPDPPLPPRDKLQPARVEIERGAR